MADLASEVERVVREVLAEIERAPSRRDSATVSSPVLGREAGDLILLCRVVTLADLPERWEGVRRVVVPPRAVITPSVQDVLRQKGMTLTYALADVTEADGRVRVAVVAHGASHDPTALMKFLTEDGFSVEARTMDCLIAATDRLAEELRAHGVAGLLLTRHVAAAVCLANRLPGVRAVQANRPDTVVAEADAVGANLLVIDPRAHGLLPTQQIVRRFVRGAPRECPDVFKKRLG